MSDMRFGREVLQARLLAALFRQDLGRRLALKGGMAMRAAYGSMRYTKDNDLAADPSLTIERVERAVGGAIRSAVAGGLISNVQVVEPRGGGKRTETTLRWKINGVIGGSKVHLTVEVSRRDRIATDELRRVTYEPPAAHGTGPIVLDVYDMSLMATGKLDCLCNPRREEPRDLHDLGILIELGVTPPPEMVARIGLDRLKQGLEGLWAKLEKMDADAAVEALRPFMSPEDIARLTPEAWDDLRMRVGVKAEAWMQAAIDEAELAAPDAPGGPARR